MKRWNFKHEYDWNVKVTYRKTIPDVLFECEKKGEPDTYSMLWLTKNEFIKLAKEMKIVFDGEKATTTTNKQNGICGCGHREQQHVRYGDELVCGEEGCSCPFYYEKDGEKVK